MMQNSSPPTLITYMEVSVQSNTQKQWTNNFSRSTTHREKPMTKDEIHHKPTFTDTTTNFFSNHPTEHKVAACRYVTARYFTLALTPTLTRTKTRRTQRHTLYIRRQQPPIHTHP